MTLGVGQSMYNGMGIRGDSVDEWKKRREKNEVVRCRYFGPQVHGYLFKADEIARIELVEDGNVVRCQSNAFYVAVNQPHQAFVSLKGD